MFFRFPGSLISIGPIFHLSFAQLFNFPWAPHCSVYIYLTDSTPFLTAFIPNINIQNYQSTISVANSLSAPPDKDDRFLEMD